jgi:hypothetical protein
MRNERSPSTAKRVRMTGRQRTAAERTHAHSPVDEQAAGMTGRSIAVRQVARAATRCRPPYRWRTRFSARSLRQEPQRLRMPWRRSQPFPDDVSCDRSRMDSIRPGRCRGFGRAILRVAMRREPVQREAHSHRRRVRRDHGEAVESYCSVHPCCRTGPQTHSGRPRELPPNRSAAARSLPPAGACLAPDSWW